MVKTNMSGTRICCLGKTYIICKNDPGLLNDVSRFQKVGFTEKANYNSPKAQLSAFNAHMGAHGSPSQDANGFNRKEAKGKLRWLVADYKARNVVFHTPRMIHVAIKNE